MCAKPFHAEAGSKGIYMLCAFVYMRESKEQHQSSTRRSLSQYNYKRRTALASI